MAKKERMVTRTIDLTMVEALMVDIVSATVSNVTLQVPGKYSNSPELLELVRANNESDTMKVAGITAARPESRLYGMTESEFMLYGQVLPPRMKAEQGEQDEQEKAAE